MDRKNFYRYIVPFKVKNNDFDEICEKIGAFEDFGPFTLFENKETSKFKGSWKIMDNISTKEHDIYDSVRDSFFDKREGSTWEYKLCGSANNGSIIEFYFRENDNKYIKVCIKSLYLTICRTGIGFIYYTINFPKKVITEEAFIKFHSSFKELNGLKNKNQYTWMVETDKSFTMDGFDNPVNIVYPYNDSKTEVKKKERDIWYVPFSMGNWLACRLSFIDIEYFAGRKNKYLSMINEYFGYSELKDDELRKDIANKTGLKEIVPDKAIIFNALLIEKGTIDDVERFVYNVTNGYTNKYDISDGSRQEMIYPFKNVIFYATNQGAGYYSIIDEENRDIFIDAIDNKINDYFLLYLDVLYQSYSIINFSHELSGKDFSYEYNDYISANGCMREKLSVIRAKINLFLVKSMTASVSYIHHHNIFYSYLEKVLNIKDDVEHLISGLDALDDLHKQQEEERYRKQKDEENRNKELEFKARREFEDRQKESDRDLQFSLSGVALLAGFSALSDSQTFFTDVFKNFGQPEDYGFYIWIIFGILIFMISLGMYKKLWKAFYESVFHRGKS